MLRFVSFAKKSGSKHVNVGSLICDQNGNPSAIVDLTNAFKLNENDGMIDFIEKFSSNKITKEIVVEHTSNTIASGKTLPFEEISLSAPIPIPRRNVMCVGKNYSDHVKEIAATSINSGSISASSGPDTPTFPQYFSKVANSVIGPSKYIENHSGITKWLDYEAELAVIIGSKCRDVPKCNAMEVIFGYTVANDVTARDLQRKHNQWFKGKSLDTTCPMGPCILLASDISEKVHDLSIKLWVNGEKRQDSRTSKMIFNIPELIHQLSSGITVYLFVVIHIFIPYLQCFSCFHVFG